MSVFRDFLISKAAKTADYIRLSPEEMDFTSGDGESTLNVESNSSWNLTFRDN